MDTNTEMTYEETKILLQRLRTDNAAQLANFEKQGKLGDNLKLDKFLNHCLDYQAELDSALESLSKLIDDERTII